MEILFFIKIITCIISAKLIPSCPRNSHETRKSLKSRRQGVGQSDFKSTPRQRSPDFSSFAPLEWSLERELSLDIKKAQRFISKTLGGDVHNPFHQRNLLKI
ncbi:hypothetical protein NPIL_494861 [Nephila pilipes]|uniref:Uncharacterized protein n=1 Tax=Nephila pilipes TaxID=299642 RepID=A0A8X6U0Y2_NEPPI|nr:hypothetical protein NPIL_494861 [Nephila pilipes]